MNREDPSTFHGVTIPRSVREAVEAEIDASGRSKSRITTEALRDHLAIPPDVRRKLDEAAKRAGSTRGEITARALQEWLRKNPKTGIW